MSEPERQPGRRGGPPPGAEAWWAALIRVASFCVGAYILLSQVDAPTDKPWLIGASIICMGPLAVGLSADLIAAIGRRFEK